MDELPVEDTTTDTEILHTADVVKAVGREFTRPPDEFKGRELFPYRYRYELYFNQVRDPEDTGLYTWLAFVFLRLKKDSEDEETHKAWARKVAWRVDSFREELSAWMDENGPFTNEDTLEAKRIYDESLKAAAETTVEVVPSKGARSSQKKTRRRKQPPLSTS